MCGALFPFFNIVYHLHIMAFKHGVYHLTSLIFKVRCCWCWRGWSCCSWHSCWFRCIWFSTCAVAYFISILVLEMHLVAGWVYCSHSGLCQKIIRAEFIHISFGYLETTALYRLGCICVVLHIQRVSPRYQHTRGRVVGQHLATQCFLWSNKRRWRIIGVLQDDII